MSKPKFDYANDPNYLTLKRDIERSAGVIGGFHAEGMMADVRAAFIAYLLETKPWESEHKPAHGVNYYRVVLAMGSFEDYAATDLAFANMLADSVLVDDTVRIPTRFLVKRTSFPEDPRVASFRTRFILP